MNLHEYQAKALFSKYGIPVPEGGVAHTPEQARQTAAQLGGTQWMVKAQVQAGGRGKAGGVLQVTGLAAVHEAALHLLGGRLVTAQTGSAGLPVNAVLIERPTKVAQELYLSLLVDRLHRRVAIIASAAGGMAIEEIAAQEPQRMLTEQVHPVTGLQPWQGRRLAFQLGLEGAQVAEFMHLALALYRLFLETDATLIEINPLALTHEGHLLALDAKLNLDDNAIYRHADLAALRDDSQEDPREVRARGHHLNYIPLEGDIGCMVNGAGLAMATMDLIQLCGGRPANFLDVGGGTTAKRVAEAFKLILADAQVKAVLVNIFGGIVRCDLIAEGILQAVCEVDPGIPLVVRLEGTNAREGLSLLAHSEAAIEPVAGLAEAARRVVQRAGESA